jgi:hypothetical protein
LLTEDDLPQGSAPEQQVVDSLSLLLETRAACERIGDFASAFSLYTPEYAAFLLASNDEPPSDILSATPFATPVIDVSFVGIQQVTLLENGTITAIVTFAGADKEDSVPGTGVVTLDYFVQIGDEWRIDREYSEFIDAEGHLHSVIELLG